MSPIKDFSLTCEAINEQGTFSAGDTIAGVIIFTLTKDTKVKSLLVKAKGDANVHWTEGCGEDEESYSAHRRYFKVKEYVVAKSSKDTMLPKGIHQFKFRLQIPEGDMPSSFQGAHGKIVYMLEAKLSRSWRLDSTQQKEIRFVSKTFPDIGQIMCPQSGTVNKEMGTFSKGEVQMSATANTKVCSPGDTLSVVAKICNSSSKTMKPKFKLQQKTVYRASGSTNTCNKTLFKMVGDTIVQNSEKTISCKVKVPVDAILTLHNCEIVSVEYYLQVYLDISFAFDPEVVFPLVVVPSSFVAMRLGEPVGCYPPGAVGAPSYSDFPATCSFPVGVDPAPTGSGAYGYPAPNPTPPAGPYGFSTAPFPPSLMQHPAPTGPPQFQPGQAPPEYTSLFPPFNDTVGKSGSDHQS